MIEFLAAERNHTCDVATQSELALSQQLNTYAPEMRERFLLRVINGDINNVSDVSDQAERLKIPCIGYRHCVCVIGAEEAAPEIDAEVVLFSLKKQLLDFGKKHNLHVHCAIDLMLRLYCVISYQGKDGITLAGERFPDMIRHTSDETGVALHYGLGPEVDRIELLSESSDYALAILDSATTLGKTTKQNIQQNRKDIQQRLLHLFRDGDMQAITDTIKKHVETIRLDVSGRQVLIERFAVLYLQNITNECMRLGITLERFEGYVPAVVCLMQLDSIGSINAILQLTEQILKYLSVRRTIESNHLLKMAKDYMAENISNERLDLATVSDHVGLSRVYFCKLFHQLEGVSFGAYLKKVRIEKAKQLLLTTNMKVYEVSNAVGYSHAKYFGQVFKEVVGQTPVEFQKSMQDNL